MYWRAIEGAASRLPQRAEHLHCSVAPMLLAMGQPWRCQPHHAWPACQLHKSGLCLSAASVVSCAHRPFSRQPHAGRHGARCAARGGAAAAAEVWRGTAAGIMLQHDQASTQCSLLLGGRPQCPTAGCIYATLGVRVGGHGNQQDPCKDADRAEQQAATSCGLVMPSSIRGPHVAAREAVSRMQQRTAEP
jgi:hypothetical protein